MGHIQRRVLEVLAERDKLLDSIEVCGRVFGKHSVDDAEHASVRRALRSLAKRGLVVDMSRHWHNRRRYWALPDRAEAYKQRHREVWGYEWDRYHRE